MFTVRKLAIISVIALAACGGDGPTAPADPHLTAAGTYALTTYNGGTLPQTTFSNSAGRIELVSATMVLRPDRSYTETRNYRLTVFSGGAPTINPIIENGTYLIVGTQITFSIPPSAGDPGLSYTGSISGTTLTYTYQSDAYTYARSH